MTTLGVGSDGSLALLGRVDAVMQPASPRPPLVFPPADGVTAMATLSRYMCGAYGLAYAPSAQGIAAPPAVPAGTGHG